jgi:hypothetical protein
MAFDKESLLSDGNLCNHSFLMVPIDNVYNPARSILSSSPIVEDGVESQASEVSRSRAQGVSRSSTAWGRMQPSTACKAISPIRPHLPVPLSPEPLSLLPSSPLQTHLSSKMAIIRCAKGLLAICGIWRNSSLSILPLPSLSSFMNRFFRRMSSA